METFVYTKVVFLDTDFGKNFAGKKGKERERERLLLDRLSSLRPAPLAFLLLPRFLCVGGGGGGGGGRGGLESSSLLSGHRRREKNVLRSRSTAAAASIKKMRHQRRFSFS